MSNVQAPAAPRPAPHAPPIGVRCRAASLVAFNALLLVWTVARPASHATVVAVCDLAYVVGPLLAFLWCLPRPAGSMPALATPNRTGGLRGQGAWLCLSLGCLGYALGSVIWAYYEVVRQTNCPFPSAADVVFLSAYPFLFAGVLLLPRRPLSALLRGRVLVDCLTVMAALATFSWYFVCGPAVARGAESWAAALLGAGYPACDLVLLFCVLVLGRYDGGEDLRGPVRLLGTGLLAIAVVDTVFAYQTQHGTYVTGRPVDVLWPLGYMLVGLAAWELRRVASGADTPMPVRDVPAPARPAAPGPVAALVRPLLPYLLVLPVGLLLLDVHRTGAGGLPAYGVYLGTAAVVALTFARQAFAAAENARLTRELQAAYAEARTAHRRLEQAHATLTRSEERFRVASQCASDLIYEWDPASGQLRWFGDIDGQLGYAAGAFPRTLAAWEAAVHPDDRPRVRAAVDQQARTGGPFSEEYRVRRHDGSWCHWIDRGMALRDARGGGVRFVGSVTDVTDRRRAEQEVRAGEARLRRQNAALVELARRQGSGAQGLADALAAVSETAARTLDVERCSVWLLNDDRSAIRCLDLFERTPARHSAGVELAAAQYPAYFRALDEDRTIVADDAHADSRTCEFSASYLAPLGITSMLDAPIRVGGVTVGVVCHEHVGTAPRRWTIEEQHFADCMTNLVAVALEADRRRRMQEALQEESRANEKLERERAALRDAVTAMEQVLGVVGHELRTPLAGLRAMSEFLLTDGAREAQEWDTFLQGIRDEVVRMAGTVNDMLEAARLNSGRAKWNWSALSLRATCEEAMDSIRPLVDHARVRLECSADPEDLQMRGDAEALRRLVLNLLSNAARHTPDGHIRVSARLLPPGGAAGEWVEVSVADTGEGIAPEIVARLGEAFALNAGIVGSNYVSGTGLGLAICKGIVTAHGGTMHVASTPGRGTTVTARLRRDLDGPLGGESKVGLRAATPSIVGA